MIYSFSGGLDKPSSSAKGIPEVVEPAGFDVRNVQHKALLEILRADGSKGQPYLSGLPLDPETLPKVVRILDEDHIVDLDSNGLMFFVSPRARDLIERFDPGLHQFEPVTFVDYAGNKLADMFVFVITQRLDTMDRDRTNMILYHNLSWNWAKDVQRWEPDFDLGGIDVDAPPIRAFSLSQIGDAGLWRDKYLTGEAFASQAFVDAFKAEGLKGLAKAPVEGMSQ